MLRAQVVLKSLTPTFAAIAIVFLHELPTGLLDLLIRGACVPKPLQRVWEILFTSEDPKQFLAQFVFIREQLLYLFRAEPRMLFRPLLVTNWAILCRIPTIQVSITGMFRLPAVNEFWLLFCTTCRLEKAKPS